MNMISQKHVKQWTEAKILPWARPPRTPLSKRVLNLTKKSFAAAVLHLESHAALAHPELQYDSETDVAAHDEGKKCQSVSESANVVKKSNETFKGEYQLSEGEIDPDTLPAPWDPLKKDALYRERESKRVWGPKEYFDRGRGDRWLPGPGRYSRDQDLYPQGLQHDYSQHYYSQHHYSQHQYSPHHYPPHQYPPQQYPPQRYPQDRHSYQHPYTSSPYISSPYTSFPYICTDSDATAKGAHNAHGLEGTEQHGTWTGMQVTSSGTHPDDMHNAWQMICDAYNQRTYWHNTITKESTWEDPRFGMRTEKPEVAREQEELHEDVRAGYNPKIHGSYAAWKALQTPVPDTEEVQISRQAPAPIADYTSTASFNRSKNTFTNTAVHPTRTPDAHSDAAKSHRQMNAFFDVDAANQAQTGMSGKEERSKKQPTKKELKFFKQRKAEKKEKNLRDFLGKD